MKEYANKFKTVEEIITADGVSLEGRVKKKRTPTRSSTIYFNVERKTKTRGFNVGIFGTKNSNYNTGEKGKI